MAVNLPPIVFVFPLEVAEYFKFFKAKEFPRSESSPAEQVLGKERRHESSVFPCCFLKYPAAVVLCFLGTRAWHQHFLYTPCNSGREVRRAVVLPLEQAQGRAAMTLQEEGCKADGLFSTSHLFVCIHLESLVRASCEKCITDYNWARLEKTVPYTMIIISLSGKVVYLLFLVYCLSEHSTFEILF